MYMTFQNVLTHFHSHTIEVIIFKKKILNIFISLNILKAFVSAKNERV